MNQPAKAPEPTMEEILASIRRIIADDDAGKTPGKPDPIEDVKDDVEAILNGPDHDEGDTELPAADVLELTESMQAVPPFQPVVGAADVTFSDAPEPEPERPPPAERPLPELDRGLMSPRASAVVDKAFSSLAHTVLVQNARTLDDLVREMLKPMLKAWLDDNLPNMVERLVRSEIERVSRGRG
jgi:cell pole-organizing protein PopZ